jgi:predicted DNA-binding protein YlxM (UPF0122 family)
MKKLDEKVIQLYKNKFFSVQQIAEKFNVSLSKIRYILDKNHVERRNIGEAITCLYLTKFNKGAFKIKDDLNEREERLRVAGVMLYWGEGTKVGNSVSLSNSDPEMIKVFLKFLRNICGISEDRLRVLLHIYPDHDEKKLKVFWSDMTNIPEHQFSKTSVHRKKGGTYKKTSKYGTILLRYSDKRLLNIIISWIKEFSKNV